MGVNDASKYTVRVEKVTQEQKDELVEFINKIRIIPTVVRYKNNKRVTYANSSLEDDIKIGKNDITKYTVKVFKITQEQKDELVEFTNKIGLIPTVVHYRSNKRVSGLNYSLGSA